MKTIFVGRQQFEIIGIGCGIHTKLTCENCSWCHFQNSPTDLSIYNVLPIYYQQFMPYACIKLATILYKYQYLQLKYS